MAYYFRNTKFKSLLNQFKNYNHIQTIQKLNQIQSRYNYSLKDEVPIEKPNYLESLFKDNNNFKTKGHKLDKKEVFKPVEIQAKVNRTTDYKQAEKTKVQLDRTDNAKIESSDYKQAEKPKPTSYVYTNPLLEKLQNQFIVVETRKNAVDRYSQIYFQALSNDFSISQNKQEMLKHIKLDIITIFRKEQLFKSGNYSAKDFKKSDIDELLTENRDIPMKMLKVYGDVFNTNIVYTSLVDMNTIYLNTYIDNRATVYILEDSDKLYSIKSKQANYILGIEAKPYIHFQIVREKTSLEKKLLEEIQNIANALGISIKKEGKSGLINKKKEEIIDEIVKQ